ncbi:MAG: hypothetical protein ACFNZD_01310 [Candidatus Nanoperiomorbus sp.]
MVSQTSANNKLQNTPGIPDKPRKPKKKWRTVLKVIAIIILVKILVIITLANYFSPDNKVKRYLHAKYGSNRELSVDGGCFAGLDGGQRHDATEWWQVIEWRNVILMIVYLALPLPDLNWWRLWEWPNPIEQFCSWRASFKDDSGHKFKVWLDDNYGNRSLQDNYNEVKSGKVSSED